MTEDDLITALNETEADRVIWKTAAITAGNEIAGLKAQVNCLREGLKKSNKFLHHVYACAKDTPENFDMFSFINDNDALLIGNILDATPEQCLAEVKANAIYEAVEGSYDDFDCVTPFDLRAYAKQLREQAK